MLLENECGTPMVAGYSADDSDVDASNTPCLACEQQSPSHVGSPRSLSQATLAKCRGTATRWKCQLILLVLGTSFVTLGVALWFFDPLEILIRQFMAFHEGSYAFEEWKKPQVPVTQTVYIFNVTNSEGFLERGEKLHVEEVGPYVYIETLRNVDIKFNENGTLTYTPLRRSNFSEQLSEKDARQDVVIIPNLALIVLMSLSHSLPYLLRVGVQSLASTLNTPPFISVTVDDLMMGYEDQLVTIANKFVPRFIPFSKIGIFDLFQREVDTYTMKIGPDDPSRTNCKLYSLDNINGSPGLKYWGYGETYIETDNGTLIPEMLKCNAIQGAYEGVIFPRYIPKNETLWIFRKYCCRPLPLVFEKETTVNNMRLHQYKLQDGAFDPPDMNPDNVCYCDDYKNECLPVGLADVSPCYYNFPAAISFPHFYMADEKLVQAIDGMSPDEEKHKSYYSILPELGVPVAGHSKIQVNLIARKNGMKSTAAFDNLVLPIIWMDTSMGSFPDNIQFLMRLSVNEGPLIQTVLIILLLISGLSLVIVVIAQKIFTMRSTRQQSAVMHSQLKN